MKGQETAGMNCREALTEYNDKVFSTGTGSQGVCGISKLSKITKLDWNRLI